MIKERNSGALGRGGLVSDMNASFRPSTTVSLSVERTMVGEPLQESHLWDVSENDPG
jgi:hypothetical protein